MVFPVQKIRQDFPILDQKIGKHPLVYLDTAASAQKPKTVIETMRHYDTHDHANIHRGVHTLSQRATEQYEAARKKIQTFLNADQSHEIIFVRGTTEAINLVAQSYGRAFLKAEDEILISAMEHHSNIVPWQFLCAQNGCKLKVIPMNEQGELDQKAYENLLSKKTRLVALAHISNALGSVNPVEEMIEKAHAYNIPVLIDGAQAVPHQKIDVKALDCDFYAFSGHKLYGPTGIGVLYGKTKWLEKMPPYQGGGDMISRVSFEKSDYNVIPYKFEAGTPAISATIGLGAAIDYVDTIGLQKISTYEAELLAFGTALLSEIDGLKLIGTAKNKASVLSFVFDGIHPHDLGTFLDQKGIAVRTGHHCAMPVMEFFKIPATTRASLGFYNTQEELKILATALREAKTFFG